MSDANEQRVLILGSGFAGAAPRAISSAGCAIGPTEDHPGKLPGRKAGITDRSHYKRSLVFWPTEPEPVAALN